jgi:hypothetical protein
MSGFYSSQNTGAESTSIDNLFRQAADEITSLAADLRRHRAAVGQFHNVEGILASLPLGTHEYALAMRRVSNARMYYCNSQYGAAIYELRLLGARLLNHR